MCCRICFSHDESEQVDRTILVAGHETVANSVAWILYELSKHPKAQDTLRAEIKTARRTLSETGRQEFELQNYENMLFLVAVIKVEQLLSFFFVICPTLYFI